MITIGQGRKLYPDDDPVPDFDHILRVFALAERIGTAEGAELEVLQAAALLHDVGRDEAEEANPDHAEFTAGRAHEIKGTASLRNVTP